MGGMRRRRLGATVAGLALVTSGLVATPAPAGAAPVDSDALVFVSSASGRTGVYRNDVLGLSTGGGPVATRPFAGAFTYFGGQSIFQYSPGPTPDGILVVEPDGTGEGFGTRFIPKTVNGTYQPVVGDFDGNGYDDVLWYAPGPAADSLWLFSGNGAHSVRSRTVNGSYRPAVIDANGDGHDDIVWYAPGTVPDSLWLSGVQGTYTTKPVTITDDYQLVVGRFGDRPEGSPQEQLLFWKEDGYQRIWTFDTAASHTSRALYSPYGEPVVADFDGNGRDSVLYYNPGSAAWEGIVDFYADGGYTYRTSPQVVGTYDPVVGDFDGDGGDDIAWTRAGKATIWLMDPDGATRDDVRVDLGITDSHAFAAEVLVPD